MSKEIMLSFDEDGFAIPYDDTYDITIHCENSEEQEEAIKALKNIHRWIPCSERLPKECEEVLITWTNTNPESYYADIKGVPFTGCGLYCKGRWYWYSATCKDYLQDYGCSIADEVDDGIKITA